MSARRKRAESLEDAVRKLIEDNEQAKQRMERAQQRFVESLRDSDPADEALPENKKVGT